MKRFDAGAGEDTPALQIALRFVLDQWLKRDGRDVIALSRDMNTAAALHWRHQPDVANCNFS